MSLLMESTASSLHSRNKEEEPSPPPPFNFDSSSLQKQPNFFPPQFLWPKQDLIRNQGNLKEPLIDMEEALSKGDEYATSHAAELVRIACKSHGFFQVTNHGVDAGLIAEAHGEIDRIFRLPCEKKMRARRRPGSVCGYAGAHADRYSSKLPWKETFSCGYSGKGGDDGTEVVDYFKSVLGHDFEHTGGVYQRYSEAMKKLSQEIFELLAISLGVDRLYYREYFEDSSCIMRCNSYPPCKNYGLTLGTGPHCDATSLTILHQDQVGGLEVFANNMWQAVLPRPDAFVINIGDTFMALSNGRYKSCQHRVVVNREQERRSLVFFVSPREDKVVRPLQQLVTKECPRKYPDFTWSLLLDFTQNHYRADVSTLQSFFHWLHSST